MGELLQSPQRPREFLYAPGRPALQPLVDALRAKGATGHAAEPPVMAFASDLTTPPGLIVRADRPSPLPADRPFWSAPAPLLVVLEGLQSPANVGAVLRAAEAAGAHGVLWTPGTADPWGPKALRASAGSAFRLPLVPFASIKEALTFLTTQGVTPVAADARADRSHTERDWTGPTALVLGSEGRGLTDLGGLNVERVRIPMAGAVESLNVAVAAGVLLFEAARQRPARP